MSFDISSLAAAVARLDTNGATRQVGLSAVLVLVLAIFAVRPGRLRTGWYAIILAVMAGMMTILAYTVRNPCRPIYVVGCGVNLHMYAGLALAACVLLCGLAMVIKRVFSAWLLTAYAMYYIHYDLGFTHKLSDTEQLAILTAVAVSLLMWFGSALYYRRRAAS